MEADAWRSEFSARLRGRQMTPGSEHIARCYFCIGACGIRLPGSIEWA